MYLILYVCDIYKYIHNVYQTILYQTRDVYAMFIKVGGKYV